MKKILLLSVIIILLFSVFSCGEPEYSWYLLPEFENGNYFTAQSGTYECGFVSICTWLKWLNKNPWDPSIDRLDGWLCSNGYGNKVKTDGMTGPELEEIMNKVSNDLVNDWWKRIKVVDRNFNSQYYNYYRDLYNSVNIYAQPIVTQLHSYQVGSQVGSHFMVTYGFVCNKNNIFDYGSYIKFRSIDGNANSTNGKIAVSREEFIGNWQPITYICDNRL